jgi:hypothetical protein
LLNPDGWGVEKGWQRLSRGEPHTSTRRSIEVKARMYRAALVMGVVAVFLEGLGAGLKW